MLLNLRLTVEHRHLLRGQHLCLANSKSPRQDLPYISSLKGIRYPVSKEATAYISRKNSLGCHYGLALQAPNNGHIRAFKKGDSILECQILKRPR